MVSITNGDMPANEAVHILDKLQHAIHALHERYIHALATRESLIVAVNTQVIL